MFAPRSRPRPVRPAPRRAWSRPRLESLEDRTLPSTLTVTTLADSGPGSLRDEIGLANNGDTVNFAAGVRGTITLTTGELQLRRGVAVQGPGAGLLAVSGNNASRAFEVFAGANVSLSGLTITAGRADDGGGIYNGGTLTVSGSTFSGNSTNSDGGGISSTGTVTVSNSTFANNFVPNDGGGIDNEGTGTVTGCTFSGNSATNDGGGITNDNTATVSNCTFSGNSARRGSGMDSDGTATVTGSTLSGNSASNGGSIYIGSGSAMLRNTIVAGNTGGDVFGTVSGSSSYNLIGTGGSGGLVNGVNHNLVGVSNPGLAALADNGGPTQTIALLAGSPAIAAGDPTLAGTPDQRGIPRHNTPSIGACEFGMTFTVTTLADSGPGSLRAEIGLANNGDTVNFAGSVRGTITLTTGELQLRRGVALQGPGAGLLAVSGNNASRAFEVFAGANVSLSGLTLTGGRAASDGGAILNNNGATLAVSNCTLSDNSAGGYGGGISNDRGTVTVSNSTLSHNSARGGSGGGIDSELGALAVSNSTFSDNSTNTDGVGGGIYTANLGSRTTVSNSTFSGNHAAYKGGGIFSRYTLALSGCTLSGNSAGNSGAGVDDEPGPLTVENTLVADNQLAGGTASDLAGDPADPGSAYNLIGIGGSGGLAYGVNHNLVGVANPGLGSLLDNGGPARTLALLAGSPALGAGDPALAGTPEQRGVSRAAPVSIGAYEGLATATALSASAGMTVYGQTVTLTATASGAGPLTGTVTFRDGPTVLTVVALDGSGHAAYSTAALGVGTHALTAAYSGTAAYQPSTGSATVAVSPGAASALAVSVLPATAPAGSALGVTVTAYDAYGNVATGYAGTVTFRSSAAWASLPGDYTFGPADQGRQTFAATLYTAGAQTVTAADTGAAFAGSGGVVVTPLAAASFTAAAPPAVVAGDRFGATVTALDVYGNVATGYAGTVALSSTDPAAPLLGGHGFTAADAGAYTFGGLQLFTAGPQALYASDGTAFGEADLTVSPAAAASLVLSGPSNASAGVAFTLTVTAYDAYGNVATGYTGTVSFSSDDTAAGLPSNYAFQPGDHGAQSFQMTLWTPGTRRVTVTDTLTPSVSGYLDVLVS